MNKITFVYQKSGIEVFSDGVSYFNAPADLVKKTGVKDGQLLTDEELEAFRVECLIQTGRRRAEWLLSIKDYNTKQFSVKIAETIGDREIAENIAAEFAEEGMLDDENLCRHRAERLLNDRLYSPAKTVYALVGEGFDKELASQCVQEADYDEIACLQRLIEKKHARTLDDENGLPKLIAKLRQQGFTYEMIKLALE